MADRQHQQAALVVDDLMLMRDEELASRLGAVRALRDYWIARARLERASACDLDGLEPAEAPMSYLRWAPPELAGPPSARLGDSEPEVRGVVASRGAAGLPSREDGPAPHDQDR
jgi:hypothetical protein